jgi:hypothetical protein
MSGKMIGASGESLAGARMTAIANIEIPYEEIAAFCERNHIRKLSLFGSVLRDDFTAESDVDVLVEFAPEHSVGFFKFIALQDELSEMLGRHVDLNTPDFLNRIIRKRVLPSARVLYDRSR